MNIITNGILNLEDLNKLKGSVFELSSHEKSALFIIDMNNGFVKKGALSSPNVEAIIPNVVDITRTFTSRKLPVIAFTDCHEENSPEFLSYPVHCLKGSEESEVIDEIKAFGEQISIIPKNSTNALHEAETKEAVDKLIEEGYTDFVLTGCCTDICVMQFALSLKTYFNYRNIKANVIVAYSGVETYDAPWHDSSYMNAFALYNMQLNGIEIVEFVK